MQIASGYLGAILLYVWLNFGNFSWLITKARTALFIINLSCSINKIISRLKRKMLKAALHDQKVYVSPIIE